MKVVTEAIKEGVKLYGNRNRFNVINTGSEENLQWEVVPKEAKGSAGMDRYEDAIRLRREEAAKHRPSVLNEEL
ncbi:hypothetical protein ACQVTS_07700 [Bacillus mycoides]|uniref:hypothetical protein n=1 Tax=Bacillus mycoides TaxID=1405 RepID=UPI003D646A8C